MKHWRVWTLLTPLALGQKSYWAESYESLFHGAIKKQKCKKKNSFLWALEETFIKLLCLWSVDFDSDISERPKLSPFYLLCTVKIGGKVKWVKERRKGGKGRRDAARRWKREKEVNGGTSWAERGGRKKKLMETTREGRSGWTEGRKLMNPDERCGEWRIKKPVKKKEERKNDRVKKKIRGK